MVVVVVVIRLSSMLVRALLLLAALMAKSSAPNRMRFSPVLRGECRLSSRVRFTARGRVWSPRASHRSISALATFATDRAPRRHELSHRRDIMCGAPCRWPMVTCLVVLLPAWRLRAAWWPSVAAWGA